ncbi:MAG: hypothetical protein IJA32_06600 [Lachnospiraceae bacterium]|nr:hypothetical protein [Lachnospiraceae bacterium]
MDRLTEKFVCNLPDEVLEKLGIADIPKEDYEIKGTNGELCRETCEKYECDSCPIQKAIEKLAEYEDAEEQGLFLRLPCKVGDTIYRINIGAKEPIIKMRVLQVQWKQLHKDRVIIRIDAINDDDMGESCYLLEDIGKTVFLTKEEAEQALEQMGE